jgi:tetratricopeptide (TPR) repeat protein
MGQRASRAVFGEPPAPTHFDVLDNAEQLRKQGAFEASMEAYTEAIEMFPTYYFSWLRRATLQTEMGLYGAAFDDLAECERLRPTDPEVYLARAAIYEAQDEFEEAAKERARMPDEAKATHKRQKEQAAEARAAAEEAELEETEYAQKYGEHEARLRKAMQHDHNRQRMVTGKRGHYVQSESDKKIVQRRANFKTEVMKLDTAAGSRSGGYTALGAPSSASKV